MIIFEKPLHCDADSLHAQIDSLGFSPYSISWGDKLGFQFDNDLTDEQHSRLEAVVAAHDGRAAVEAASAREAAVAAMLASGAALVESARAKRIAGVALTPSETAATLDALLFQGSP